MEGRLLRYDARGVSVRARSARSAAAAQRALAPPASPSAETHDRQFDLLFAELQRRLASQDRRLANTETRANTLIASAAILAGLLTAAPQSYEILVALVVNIAAAGFGIATMFPRSLEELSPRKMRDKLLKADGEQAALHLSDKYLQLIEKTERWINVRMRLIQVGLGTLGASLVLAAIAISKSVGGG